MPFPGVSSSTLIPHEHASHFVDPATELLRIPAEFLFPLITLHGEPLELHYAIPHVGDEFLRSAVHCARGASFATMNDPKPKGYGMPIFLETNFQDPCLSAQSLLTIFELQNVHTLIPTP